MRSPIFPIAVLLSITLSALPTWGADDPAPAPGTFELSAPVNDAMVESRVQGPQRTLLRGDPTDMIQPEPLAEIEPLSNANWADDACGADCAGCGGCGAMACGPASCAFFRVEYLLWAVKGMDLPPLVTTSPYDAATMTPPISEAGVLGFPTTQILYGNDSVLNDARSGMRLRAGVWLDSCRRYGLNGEYFGLWDVSEVFSASSDATGLPILARPFFNINPRVDADFPADVFDGPAREAAEQVAYPDVLAGTVAVTTRSSLQSAAAHFRANVCCKSWCWSDPCRPCSAYGGNSRLDFLIGYRYARLREGLAITEDLTSLDTANPGDFNILDQFDTQNDFNGCELGFLWEMHQNRWFVEGMGKIALGNNRQVVDIFGTTVITPPPPGTTNPFVGGLLAQRTNIGRYSRDDFTVIPELGVTLGYQLTTRLSVSLGYTFIYWSQVVRPGEQIDLDVNPDLLPPERVPFEGALRPEFVFRATDFWAQGLNVGLDYRW